MKQGLKQLRDREQHLEDMKSSLEEKKKMYGDNLVKVLFFVPYKQDLSLLSLGHLSLLHEVNKNIECRGVADRGFFYDFIFDQKKLTEDEFISFYHELGIPDFDMVCFGLTNPGSFMDAFKFFKMLNIPYNKDERAKSYHPLIIGGGPGFSNPEPYIRFFDLFIMGNGELPILNLINYVYELKKQNLEWKDYVLQTSNDTLNNVYSPQGFKHIYNKNKLIGIDKITSNIKPIEYHEINRIPLDSHQFSSRILVNNTGVVIANKGCKYNCIFCQLGKDEIEQTPFNEITNAIDDLLKLGINNLIINSPSFTEYSHKEELLDHIYDYIILNGIDNFSLYIGSVRIDEFNDKYIQKMKQIGSFNHTYMKYTSDENGYFIATAPEFGSEKLLKLTGKGLTKEKIINGIKLCKENGINNFHLYFMVGMAGETVQDRKDIAFLVRDIYNSLNNEGILYLKINLHIPTVNTLGQRLKMNTTTDYISFLEEVQNGLNELFSEDELKKIKITPLEEYRLILESLFMRGDRKIGEVIDYLIRNNINESKLSLQAINEIFDKLGLNYNNYLSGYKPEDILPREHHNQISKKNEINFLSKILD